MTAHRCTSSRRPTVSRSRPKKRHESGRLLTGCTRLGGKHPIFPGVGVNCMSKSCLVVDDSKVIRKVARHILESMSFAVEEAADGQEDRKRVVSGKSVAVRVEMGGGGRIKKKNDTNRKKE